MKQGKFLPTTCMGNGAHDKLPSASLGRWPPTLWWSSKLPVTLTNHPQFDPCITKSSRKSTPNRCHLWDGKIFRLEVLDLQSSWTHESSQNRHPSAGCWLREIDFCLRDTSRSFYIYIWENQTQHVWKIPQLLTMMRWQQGYSLQLQNMQRPRLWVVNAAGGRV